VRYRPIADYAVIGDTQTAALVSPDGSIDWLCCPRFDSPAMFLRLLDADRGGYCSIQPVGKFDVTRSYVRDSCVLHTRFSTSGGELTVTDFMPVERCDDPGGAGKDVDSPHQVVRLVQCSGDVECRLELKVTPDYAGAPPKIIRRSQHRALVLGARDALHIQMPSACQIDDRGLITANLRMRDGEEFALVLTWSKGDDDVREMLLKDARQSLETTFDYWRNWSNGIDYEGDYRSLVHRSALTLKLLTYEPSGAIIAAPTTSLPEEIGGARNWDYRYTWLRDSSLTLVALMDLGNFGEARDYFHFLHDSLPDNAEDFQVLYRIDGSVEVDERELPLSGYRDSRPVRIGNGAVGQKQLDIFGELMHCAFLYWLHEDFTKQGESFVSDFWPLIKTTADYVAQHWRDPGHGIWEMRGPQKDFTHAKGMCWVALDRALKLAKKFGVHRGLDDWDAQRSEIRHAIETRGFHPRSGAYVQYFDGQSLDAAVLRLPLMGVIDANSDRMRSTIAAIEKRLMNNGLVYRYLQDESDDGMPGNEATFTACAFWLVENYVLQGRVSDAERLFEHTVGFVNDLGLLSEELDPHTGEQLGNFPQGFSHIALINSAVRLAAAKGQVSDITRRMLRGEAGVEESAA
jgi:GH15 family glucan-1,4-alpha-glucosidase